MITYDKLDGHICFRPTGDLTFFNIAPFSEAINAAVRETGISKVLLDCTQVGILDSAALGALVQVSRQLAAREGCLKLANARKSLRTGIAHARLDKFFAVYDTVHLALGAGSTSEDGKPKRGTRKKP